MKCETTPTVSFLSFGFSAFQIPYTFQKMYELSLKILKHCMYFPSLLSIIRWVYLDKRPFTTQLTCYVIITFFASMILFKTNLYFDSKKKSDITSFIIRSHGQDFVSSRLIAMSISSSCIVISNKQRFQISSSEPGWLLGQSDPLYAQALSGYKLLLLPSLSLDSTLNLDASSKVSFWSIVFVFVQ